MKIQPRVVLVLFIFLVCLNWAYVLWVKYQPDIIINAWFVLIPLTGYFYFTFAFIAAVGLYNGKKYGLTLAYGVILFGAISAAMSYVIIFKHNPFIESLIVPLLITNLCFTLYIASNRDYFQSE